MLTSELRFEGSLSDATEDCSDCSQEPPNAARFFVVRFGTIHREELPWDPSERVGVFHCKLLNIGLLKIDVLQDFS